MADRSVLVCSTSAEGHARPMVAVADAFVRAGWRVRMLTGAPFRDRVLAIGADWIELPPAADVHDADEHTERRTGITAMNEGATEAFLTPAPAAWAAVQGALAAERADAVVTEIAFVGAAGLAGLPRSTRPMTVACGVFPLGISDPEVAPFGLGMPPIRAPLNRFRNRALTLLATRVLLAPLHWNADRTLLAMGAEPLGGRFFMDFVLAADLVAQFTVPEFEYPRRTPPHNLRFYGPVARGVPSMTPLPEWWDRLDDRPIVHVSQGTVANRDYGELVAPTFAALGNEEVQIVVTTGGPPVSSLPPMPPNAFAAEFVPYDRLLPRTDVFVTNGGYGGLHYAMEYGVPVVVAGDTEDKPETAARSAWSGIGVDLGTGRPTGAAVRRGVRKVLGDPTYAARSAELGAAIRASRGADGLVTDVERRLSARV